jgi:ferric-dicitrate binding protein FerR (iron transport regulator)
MTKKINIETLLHKFVLNRCTPEEVDELVAYFKKGKNSNEFPEAKVVIELIKELPEMDERDAKRIFGHILETRNNTQKAFKSGRFKKYMASAAFIIILIGIALYFSLMTENLQIIETPKVTENVILLEMESGKTKMLSENGSIQLTNKKGKIIGGQEGNQLVYQNNEKISGEIEYNTLRIPYGKRFNIHLSDGSIVYMNAGSSLKYPVNFPKVGRREVFLMGEAFFEVSKDKKRPFIVNSENFRINVLGTKFNVSAYTEDRSSSVVLVEGSVKLGTKDQHSMLEPGQIASLMRKDTSFKINEVDTHLYTAWMQGNLVFRNMSFEYILKKMERKYNVTIINNNKDLANQKFNANFEDQPLNKILEYFKETYGLNYIQQEDNSIIINEKTST